ncbi:PRC-barrel domain-containing protein [Actinoplanes couchii]|uniref:PRC-barrel domain-containing protein n=1 Tax=Actinoplanes couchii TaxID=403638 RepID=A0ABQ3XT55_9ACTN|nr:PRC-barrel domain-containing protein [Actinoplanes couchii]MDR6324545.1 hypothetical protein [Actinoplanes couchii]GID61681.1 hypothetical protein Aco03nite_100850 [Actinoplanes couchii]
MIPQESIRSLYGLDVIDIDNNKIGSIGAVWTDATGRPFWASVRTGLFGSSESLLPLHDADLRGDQVVVPFDKATVKDAPNVDADADEPLGRDEVDRLYEYYGITVDDSYIARRAAEVSGDPASTGNTIVGRSVDGDDPLGGTAHRRC